MEPNALTAEQRSDVQHVLSLSKPGEHRAIDLSDDRQYRFYLHQLKASGVTPQRYPQLFQRIRDRRQEQMQHGAGHGGRQAKREIVTNGPVHGGNGPVAASVEPLDDDASDFIPVNRIISVGYNASGHAVASAVSSIPGGTLSTSLALTLISNEAGNAEIGNCAKNQAGQGEYFTIQAQSTSPAPAAGFTAQLSYSYLPHEGAEVMYSVQEVVPGPAGGPAGPPTVTEPKLTSAHLAAQKTYIKFGLGRPGGFASNQDTDYSWPEENVNNNPVVRVPLVGQQTFNKALEDPQPGLDISVDLLIQGTGGTDPSDNFSTAQLRAGFSVDASNSKILKWNFPYNSTIANDGSVTFSNTFVADSLLLISMTVQNVVFADGGDPAQFSLYGTEDSKQWNDQPTGQGPQGSGEYAFRPFEYTWHCVAPDSQVRLADGSTKAIDQLVGGDALVNNGDGGVVHVVDNVFANVDKKLLSITVESGGRLLISDFHIVITSDGPCPACDITPDHILITEEGPSKIKAIEKQHFKGLLWNIDLGYTPEEEARLNDQNRTFFANGILIGDRVMSRNLRSASRRSLESILARLPEEWHQDARSAYEDQLAQAR